jgi:hypothetical protein
MDEDYKQRKQRCEYVDVASEFNGVSLSDLVSNVYMLFERYGGDAQLDITTDDGSDECEIELCYYRWETDDEMEKRISYKEKQRALEEARRARQEAEDAQRKMIEEREERLLLKRLREKYGE